jgi:hypothetical protein
VFFYQVLGAAAARVLNAISAAAWRLQSMHVDPINDESMNCRSQTLIFTDSELEPAYHPTLRIAINSTDPTWTTSQRHG